MHTDSHAGVKGVKFNTAVLGTTCAQGVAAIQSATASKLRSATCPKPNGTEGGYIKASGHNANKTKAPCVVGSNQSSRNWFQRRMNPMRSKATATAAPKPAPNELRAQSTFDGTRRGNKFCKDSMPNDSADAHRQAHQKLWRQSERTMAKANKKPKGAYPKRLEAMSKAVQY
jgi:hypothetical protein